MPCFAGFGFVLCLLGLLVRWVCCAECGVSGFKWWLN